MCQTLTIRVIHFAALSFQMLPQELLLFGQILLDKTVLAHFLSKLNKEATFQKEAHHRKPLLLKQLEPTWTTGVAADVPEASEYAPHLGVWLLPDLSRGGPLQVLQHESLHQGKEGFITRK